MTVRDLPRFPEIELEPVDDWSSTPGFLELHRTRYRTRNEQGRISEEFVYDSVRRRALDAVVIAAYFTRARVPCVYLRSAMRPPVLYRHEIQTPDSEIPSVHFWELPAGLVEPSERTPAGLKVAASRETREELGFDIEPERFTELGPGTYPTPAVIAERQFFFCVRVETRERREPELDGSALEAAGVVTEIELSHAVDLCRQGKILDGKTEIGLRRLADVLRDVV